MRDIIRIPFLQIDAFTQEAFRGNPAAVCPLDEWLPDPVLQAIARENNVSETAFFVPSETDDADFHLRWFTPKTEVDLCGHATLAAGHAILSTMRGQGEVVRFSSQSGILVVSMENDVLSMDFPARNPVPAVAPGIADHVFGAKPIACYSGGRDYLFVFENEKTIHHLTPDYTVLKTLGAHGFIVTAEGEACDFVSRCFFPAFGVDEDPVTGSAHCVSGPFWAEKLRKNDLFARQLSPRGGEVWLRVAEDRVHISGHCVEVIAGEMSIPVPVLLSSEV